MRKISPISIAFALVCASPGFAAKLVSQPRPGEVVFEAVGRPAMMKIKGQGPAPTGEFTVEKGKASGTAELDLRTLETGMSLRDSHMKDKYLEVAKHPKAKLTVDAFDVPADFTAGTSLGEKPFKGTLLLHGVEKAVEGVFSFEGGVANARFETKLSDYGIAVPSYMGITVADTVKVSVTIALRGAN